MEGRNFVQALAIANEWLAKYPGHALFQALKFDIEERQRQELSSRIAEIDRQVETEPDLDRRVSILEQAVAEYPGEPHFERQIRPMRDKRDLVDSIAAKARYHEERGQFAEALAQWEILNTIYSQYPGLAFEMERVAKKKEQQALSEAKNRWTSQIDAAMASGDYVQALSLCGAAEAEHPNDPELAQLRKLASDSAARAEEAAKLLSEGQALSQEKSFDEGIGTMRRALDLNPRSHTIKSAIVEALVERARAVVDSDWREAEPLIQQALEIDPSHLLAKNLRIIAQDRKRDEAVNSCFTQARQFRASGDLESALAEAQKCLTAYPLDPRLAQLRDILAKELGDARRARTRPVDLESLRQIEQQAERAAETADVSAALDRARAVAGAYANDAEFEQIVRGLEQRLAAMRRAPKPPADAALEATATHIAPPVERPFEEMPTAQLPVVPPPPPTLPPEPPAAAWPPPPVPGGHIPTAAMAPPMEGPPPPESALFAIPSLPPPPPPAQGQPPRPPAGGAPPAPPRVKRPVNTKAILVGAAALALILVLAAIALLAPKLFKKGPPAGTMVRLQVRTWPPGAVIRVNGKVRGTSNFELEDKPGSYQVDAQLDGYQPASAAAQLQARLGHAH